MPYRPLVILVYQRPNPTKFKAFWLSRGCLTIPQLNLTVLPFPPRDDEHKRSSTLTSPSSGLIERALWHSGKQCLRIVSNAAAVDSL
jgi:hypothetical protein